MNHKHMAIRVAKTFFFARPVIKGQILRALERQQGTALGQTCLVAVAYMMVG